MKKLTANEMIDELVMIAGITAANNTTAKRQYALLQSIEAVKALQMIAQNGKSNEVNYEADIIPGSGGWCAEKAKAVFHE